MLLNYPKTSINEVYFGKQKELLDAEKQLDIFRNKYMGKYFISIGCNSDPDILKFNRMIENYFGFGCFSLNIINLALVNAFTCPISYRLDIINAKKNLIVDQKHYKFNKDADYACMCNIYSGLIFNDAYTTSEIMAVILHEIGHNFFSVLTTKTAVLSLYHKVVALANLITVICKGWYINLPQVLRQTTNTVDKLMSKFERLLKENIPILKTSQDIITNIIRTIPEAMYAPFYLIDLLTMGFDLIFGVVVNYLPRVAMNPFTYINMPINYKNEQTADNFVTMYGYGSELTSALNKMSSGNTKIPSRIKNVYNKIPIISHIYNMNYFIAITIAGAFLDHPDTLVRGRDQLALLEHELTKTDLDPKMRKTLEADVKLCKREINKLIDNSKGLKDRDFLRNTYYKALYKFMDGKDIKYYILNDIKKFERYDKTYNEKLNK